MTTRLRDLERQQPFNKLVGFTDPAAGGESVTTTWGSGGIVIGIINSGTGARVVGTSIETLSGRLFFDTESDFFGALNKGDAITVTLPTGMLTAVCEEDGNPYVAISLSNVTTDDTGPVAVGDAVTVTSGSLSADITAWARVDDSTISDTAAFSLIGGEAVQTGTDTRRILFIRTRADDRITVDHRARIGGLEYEVRSIQELANRGELRIAIVRVSEN